MKVIFRFKEEVKMKTFFKVTILVLLITLTGCSYDNSSKIKPNNKNNKVASKEFYKEKKPASNNFEQHKSEIASKPNKLSSTTCESKKNICESCCKVCEPCEPCKPCCKEKPKTLQPCECAYNAPARIDVACGWKVWAQASFIYWKAKEKGLQLGEKSFSANAGIDIVFDKVNMDFDYIPGFKLGFGINFCRDDWTLFLQYTRLNGDDNKNVSYGSNYDGTNNRFFSGWNFTNRPLNTMKAKWDLDYNIFDLELGRPYYLGKKVIFKPHFDLRSGWINQKYDFFAVSQTSPTAQQLNHFVKVKEDSWLIGPRIGLYIDWLIGCHFKIITNVAGSLLYQNFKGHYFEDFPIQPPGNLLESTFTYRDKITFLTPNTEFQLGLGYGRYFCKNRWYFNIDASYDFNYFWKQNFLRYLNDSSKFPYIDDDLGDLMLHGLTITARLDF